MNRSPAPEMGFVLAWMENSRVKSSTRRRIRLVPVFSTSMFEINGALTMPVSDYNETRFSEDEYA